MIWIESNSYLMMLNENMERVREEKSILEKQQGDLFLDKR